MKKYPYSNERIMQIFVQLHKRKLAMFLGYLASGEPAIWMSYESGLAKAPISIATADMLLDEITTRELDSAFRVASPEVLIGEILDDTFPAVQKNRLGHAYRGRRAADLRQRLLPAAGLPG